MQTLPMQFSHEFQDVIVLYRFRAVGQRDEVTVYLIKFAAVQPEPQFFAA
jgi:hypothetical protein